MFQVYHYNVKIPPICLTESCWNTAWNLEQHPAELTFCLAMSPEWEPTAGNFLFCRWSLRVALVISDEWEPNTCFVPVEVGRDWKHSWWDNRLSETPRDHSQSFTDVNEPAKSLQRWKDKGTWLLFHTLTEVRQCYSVSWKADALLQRNDDSLKEGTFANTSLKKINNNHIFI